MMMEVAAMNAIIMDKLLSGMMFVFVTELAAPPAADPLSVTTIDHVLNLFAKGLHQHDNNWLINR
jgi:hypothetical protein